MLNSLVYEHPYPYISSDCGLSNTFMSVCPGDLENGVSKMFPNRTPLFSNVSKNRFIFGVFSRGSIGPYRPLKFDFNPVRYNSFEK